jgi:hypothetical protein
LHHQRQEWRETPTWTASHCRGLGKAPNNYLETNMNELKFDSIENYLRACYRLAERGANFRGWEDGGYFFIEIRGV